MAACDICQPQEYSHGDGSGCIVCADNLECPCMTFDKCHNGTGCYNTGSGTYQCEPCPDGYEGDGASCSDIDEVIHPRPRGFDINFFISLSCVCVTLLDIVEIYACAIC